MRLARRPTEVTEAFKVNLYSRFGHPRTHRGPQKPLCPILLIVRDKLQKGPIRIAKINRSPAAASAGARDRTEFDLDSMRLEVVHGLIDRTRPFKTEIPSTRRNRNLRQRHRLDTRTVQIQLRVLEPVSPPLIFSDNFHPDHFAIKRV